MRPDDIALERENMYYVSYDGSNTSSRIVNLDESAVIETDEGVDWDELRYVNIYEHELPPDNRWPDKVITDMLKDRLYEKIYSVLGDGYRIITGSTYWIVYVFIRDFSGRETFYVVNIRKADFDLGMDRVKCEVATNFRDKYATEIALLNQYAFHDGYFIPGAPKEQKKYIIEVEV